MPTLFCEILTGMKINLPLRSKYCLFLFIFMGVISSCNETKKFLKWPKTLAGGLLDHYEDKKRTYSRSGRKTKIGGNLQNQQVKIWKLNPFVVSSQRWDSNLNHRSTSTPTWYNLYKHKSKLEIIHFWKSCTFLCVRNKIWKSCAKSEKKCSHAFGCVAIHLNIATWYE